MEYNNASTDTNWNIHTQNEILFLLRIQVSLVNITGSIYDHEESGLKGHFPRGHEQGLSPITI